MLVGILAFSLGSLLELGTRDYIYEGGEKD